MNLYLHFGSCVVVYFLGFYFSLVNGFENRVNERCRCLAKWNFLDYQRLIV